MTKTVAIGSQDYSNLIENIRKYGFAFRGKKCLIKA